MHSMLSLRPLEMNHVLLFLCDPSPLFLHRITLEWFVHCHSISVSDLHVFRECNNHMSTRVGLGKEQSCIRILSLEYVRFIEVLDQSQGKTGKKKLTPVNILMALKIAIYVLLHKVIHYGHLKCTVEHQIWTLRTVFYIRKHHFQYYFRMFQK